MEKALFRNNLVKKINTRTQHESAHNSIAKKGQGRNSLAESRDSVSGGVKGQRPLRLLIIGRNITMRTHSPNETRELAKRLAKELRRGDVLLLWGDLGAGKSEFTRGLAQGLGVTATVTSPSFTILNVYDDGRIPLYHFDWYRLNSVEELYEMGMEEFLGGDGVAVVEWPSQCPEAIPETHLAIRLTPVDETTRDVTITPMGGFREISLEEEQ